jgi:hypothetical protein
VQAGPGATPRSAVDESGTHFADSSRVRIRAGSIRAFRSFSLRSPFYTKAPCLVRMQLGACIRALLGGVCNDQDYESNFWGGVPLPRQWCCRPDSQPNAGISANCTFTHVAVDYSEAWVSLMKVNLMTLLTFLRIQELHISHLSSHDVMGCKWNSKRHKERSCWASYGVSGLPLM